MKLTAWISYIRILTEPMRDNRLVKIVYMRRKQRERDRGEDPERDGGRIFLLLMNDSMTIYKHYNNYICSIQCLLYFM